MHQKACLYQGYPNRTYYITGHSLGGGIAKLVAAEVLRQELKRPGGRTLKSHKYVFRLHFL